MPALRTLAPVLPERSGAALGEGPEDPLLRRADPGELGAVGADDVGELDVGPADRRERPASGRYGAIVDRRARYRYRDVS